MAALRLKISYRTETTNNQYNFNDTKIVIFKRILEITFFKLGAPFESSAQFLHTLVQYIY
jgi:hypothetical protein